ncbi:MAG TPA: hypothetical protein VHY10_17410 [Xanthobacteraceae bacterium]|jgi:hypothetical protein|nr:hypothetical protein [Xanthobacteraceae bacterium]
MNRYREDFAAKSLAKLLGDLQPLEAPAPIFLRAEVLALAAALPIFAVAMPRIDGIERVTETAVGNGDLHDERESGLVAAGFDLLQTKQIGHS